MPWQHRNIIERTHIKWNFREAIMTALNPRTLYNVQERAVLLAMWELLRECDAAEIDPLTIVSDIVKDLK